MKGRARLPRWGFLLIFCALLSACAWAKSETASRISELGGQVCLDSGEFACVTLKVPLDHFSSSDDRSIEVEFAIRPATSSRKGVFVTAVGGPGGSGLESAEYELEALDPAILDHFDVVFFDQRGVAESEELACPDADEAWDEVLITPEGLAADWETHLTEIPRYIEACIEEMGDPEILPYLGARQAIEDVEAFRLAMGYDTLVLYGESYGTSLAQQYAAAHPAQVERLVLDGTVDLTRDTIQTTFDDIEAIDGILERELSRCDRDTACSSDFGGSATEGYASLLAELLGSPVDVEYPVAPDDWETWVFEASDLTGLARDTAYSDETRMFYLRALAAAVSNDDLGPLARLGEIDPGEGISTVVNLAIGCLDAGFPGTGLAEQIDAISEARLAVNAENRWHYLHPLVCAHWPGRPLAGQIDPSPGFGVPTLVVAIKDDPATPYSHSISVVGQRTNAELLTVHGGSHVMFNRGNACVDSHVTDFIVSGTPLPTHVCVESPVPYLPLLQVSGSTRYEEIAQLIDDELWNSPELYAWDGSEDLVIGCEYGGALTFVATEDRLRFELVGCDMPGHVGAVTGSGFWDFTAGNTQYELEFTAVGCTYEVTKDWDSGDVSNTASCD